MEITKTSENRESVYELVYEENTIKELISEIITNCSYREKRKSYKTQGQTYESAYNKIVSATNWNGDRIYENVCNFFGTGDYVSKEGDVFVFEANKLLSPQLVLFLINLINGEKVDYNWFINREEIKEKERLEQKVKQLDEEINGISNFQTQWKIIRIKALEWHVNKLNSLANFDYEKLSKYYDLVEQAISIELVQETIKYKRMK